MDIIAVKRNLSKAALKVIPLNTSIPVQAGNNAGRRSSVVKECPNLDSLLVANRIAEGYRAQAPAKNGTLLWDHQRQASEPNAGGSRDPKCRIQNHRRDRRW